MNSNTRRHVVALAMAVWPLLNAVAGEWIRINQLGYLPKATKVAVLMCEEESAVKTFEIRIADDRDHVAMKLPNYDPADYGWGKNAERPVYFVDGKPQQRGKFKNATMGADSARHYQWYPFMNMGHYQIAKLSDNQRLKDEFIRNLRTGIERTYERGKSHPFLWGRAGRVVLKQPDDRHAHTVHTLPPAHRRPYLRRDGGCAARLAARLPQMIKKLRQKGYTFVSVEQMIKGK